MADNLTTTTTVATIPSGTVVATDDCGAAGHVQRVKLAIATDGSATLIPADATDGMLVNLGANNDVTVTSGAVTSTVPVASTATLANITAATASTTLQAANSNRLGLVIYNDSTSVMYMKFGSTASSTSFTHQLQAGEVWELATGGCRYTGIVTGIWVSATGAARVTELTA